MPFDGQRRPVSAGLLALLWNPEKHVWDPRNIFKNHAAKSIDEVMRTAIYIERNEETVKSVTSFPHLSRHWYRPSGDLSARSGRDVVT